jgi:hypothetical protein
MIPEVHFPMEATSSLERCGVTSDPRIAVIWHTVSPPLYDALEVGNKPLQGWGTLHNRIGGSHQFPRLPKPQESQGRGTSPQPNWRLPASPRGSQSHKNDQRPSRVPMNPRCTSSSKEWIWKSNRFGGRVDLGQLSQVLEGQGVWVARERDLPSLSLQQWWGRYFWSWYLLQGRRRPLYTAPRI